MADGFMDGGNTNFFKEEKHRSIGENSSFKRDSFGNFLNHLLILPRVDCLDG